MAARQHAPPCLRRGEERSCRREARRWLLDTVDDFSRVLVPYRPPSSFGQRRFGRLTRETNRVKRALDDPEISRAIVFAR